MFVFIGGSFSGRSRRELHKRGKIEQVPLDRVAHLVAERQDLRVDDSVVDAVTFLAPCEHAGLSEQHQVFRDVLL
jgi:hypothetical protein